LGHCISDLFGIRTEILLVHDAVLIHDEGHDAGGAIDGWIRYKGEPADHLAVREVTLCSTLCVVSLGCQNAGIVTVERYGIVGCDRPVFYTRGGDECVERTGGLVFVLSRKQAIVTIVIANEFQRVPMFAVICPCVVLAFSIDKLITSIDSGQFISTDSPRQDLSFANVRVEIPDAVFFYEWYRKRPVLSA